MDEIPPLAFTMKSGSVAVSNCASSSPNPRDLVLLPSDFSSSRSQTTASSFGMMDVDLDLSPKGAKTSLEHSSDCSFHVEEDIMLEDEHDPSYSTDELEHCDDNMSLSSGCHDEDMIMAERESSWSFWVLPPEIRELVYRNLLLSDSAFRLGHHGPYSHETRKPTYPAILKTCRMIFEEASTVLYGDNTFYLGPIGHKPTYSASFVTSIGLHNALKIRTLAAHSTNPTMQLTERSLRQWINSFGLDVSRIKILAVSFSNLESKKRPLHTQHQHQHNLQPGQILQNQIIGHHHQLSLTGATIHTTPTFGNLSTVVIPNGPGAGIGLPTVPVPLALLLSSNTTGTNTPNPSSTDNSSQNANVPQMMGFGAPLQRFTHNRFQQPQYTSTVMSTSSTLAPLSPTTTIFDMDCDDHLSVIVARLGGWLELASEHDVKEWIVLKNTDLRAGEKWLLHVSRAARRVRALG